MVSGMSREDDPSRLFNLKNRCYATSLNINICETLLVNFKSFKIYYENYLNAVQQQLKKKQF